MLKEVLASNAAKLVAACVCPVAVGTVALKVPTVRSAVHKATAPKPQQDARAKPREKAPSRKAPKREEDERPVQAALICPQPLALDAGPLHPASFEPAPPRMTRVDVGLQSPSFVSYCGTNRFMMTARTGMSVPEPETWAQMVAGFGMLGATLRAGRRRRSRAAA